MIPSHTSRPLLHVTYLTCVVTRHIPSGLIAASPPVSFLLTICISSVNTRKKLGNKLDVKKLKLTDVKKSKLKQHGRMVARSPDARTFSRPFQPAKMEKPCRRSCLSFQTARNPRALSRGSCRIHPRCWCAPARGQLLNSEPLRQSRASVGFVH